MPRRPPSSRHVLGPEGGGDLRGEQLDRAVIGERAREHQEVADPQVPERSQDVRAALPRNRHEPRRSSSGLVRIAAARSFARSAASASVSPRITEIPSCFRMSPGSRPKSLAVPGQHVELVPVFLLGHQERVPPVGHLGHHPERPALPHAAHPQRDRRGLHGLGLAQRVLQPVVWAMFQRR